MKDKILILTLASLGAALGGCVNVDKSVSETPSVYWKAPKGAVPEQAVAPERIETEKIIDKEQYDKQKAQKADDLNSQADGKWQPETAAEKLMAGQELDLADLVDIALENNTATRMYWFQSKAYAAAKGKAYSTYYPQISVGGQVYRNKTQSSSGLSPSVPVGSYYETGYGPSAEINWLIYDFGKREAQVEVAKQALLAANFDYNQSIQDVVLNVNLAYYAFYSAVGMVKAAEISLEDAKTAYESAKARYDASVGNKPDMLNALAVAKSAEYEVENAKAQVETARANLANVLGVRVSENMKVAEKVNIPSAPDTSEKVSELVAKALRSRQNLLSSYAQLRKAEEQTEVARRDFLPQIGATGSANYIVYSRDDRQDSYQYQVGLTASWSLFEGFARKYELISSKAQERVAAQQLKAAEIQIISDIWDYYHTYLSSFKQIQSTQAAVEANQEAYDATKASYDNGVSSITDLLNAQSRLSQARQQFVLAESTLASSIARLAHATGALLANTDAQDDLPAIPAPQPAAK